MRDLALVRALTLVNAPVLITTTQCLCLPRLSLAGDSDKDKLAVLEASIWEVTESEGDERFSSRVERMLETCDEVFGQSDKVLSGILPELSLLYQNGEALDKIQALVNGNSNKPTYLAASTSARDAVIRGHPAVRSSTRQKLIEPEPLPPSSPERPLQALLPANSAPIQLFIETSPLMAHTAFEPSSSTPPSPTPFRDSVDHQSLSLGSPDENLRHGPPASVDNARVLRSALKRNLPAESGPEADEASGKRLRSKDDEGLAGAIKKPRGTDGGGDQSDSEASRDSGEDERPSRSSPPKKKTAPDPKPKPKPRPRPRPKPKLKPNQPSEPSPTVTPKSSVKSKSKVQSEKGEPQPSTGSNSAKEASSARNSKPSLASFEGSLLDAVATICSTVSEQDAAETPGSGIRESDRAVESELARSPLKVRLDDASQRAFIHCLLGPSDRRWRTTLFHNRNSGGEPQQA